MVVCDTLSQLCVGGYHFALQSTLRCNALADAVCFGRASPSVSQGSKEWRLRKVSD